jgi:thioredoxin 1
MEITLTTQNFEAEVLKSEKPVLVDFWATWCGPCMRQAPIVEELVAEGYSVGKVDVDQQPDLAGQYGVMSIPTLIVFKGGKEVHRVVGLTAKNDLKRLLDE